MFKKMIFGVTFFAACSMFILSCNSGSSTSGEWVAKISGEKITADEFDQFYYAQHKSIYNESDENIDKRAEDPNELRNNPLLNKGEFLENLIRQRLVYNKAVKEGILDNKEVEALVEMAKEAVVVGYFVKEKFKDEISVTDEEVAKVYASQKARFKGAPIDQAEQYIRQQLGQQKLQKKLRDFVESLRDEEKIEKNLSLLKDVDSASGSGESGTDTTENDNGEK
ncbi:MAG: SurA N-terminal domain-containing protein [Spirochaetes bacterium]|nr:SurA N-terminal domain-containing protein [Spirochaetota bacterium]